MQAIDIPSKWDIIPIHNSDRGAFKQCRRRWNWTSPSRQNLTVRADVYGVYPPLWFGTGIHWALEQFYNPTLPRDPVEAFSTWFDIQWYGGTVTEDWLDKVYDLNPQKFTLTEPMGNIARFPGDNVYKIKGLDWILPDPDLDEWMGYRELGIEMMKYYKEWCVKYDAEETLLTEHTFSIPVWDYANNCILKARDLREDSPNHGQLLEVHSRGKMDRMWVRPNGNTGITDYKTQQAWGEEDTELVKLESDEQCTSYLYAAEVEAKYYGLEHAGTPPEEIIYVVLRKAYPKEPTKLKSGMFSIDRQKESTTHEMLQEWIAKNVPGIPLSEAQQAYVNFLRDAGDEQFIIRRSVRRNRHQIANAGYRLYQEALDMLNPEIHIYPNIRNDFSCLKCTFRAPCMAMEDGSDWKDLIAAGFTTNKDR